MAPPYFDLATDTLVLYDSAARGDPATPEQDAFAPPYGHEPQDSAAVRLELLNAAAHHRGRSRRLPPLVTLDDAWAWLGFAHDRPAYLANGVDVLTVPCPLCRVPIGRLCRNMGRLVHHGETIWTMAPHFERIDLWREDEERCRQSN